MIVIGAFMCVSSRDGTYKTMSSEPYMGSNTTVEERFRKTTEDLERSRSHLIVLSAAGLVLCC